MMKTRFLMLAMMMCMTALTFSACSDDDDDDKSINCLLYTSDAADEL